MKTLQELQKALLDAGYKTVGYAAKLRTVKGDAVQVFDVVCVPATLLDENTKNFKALSVLKEAGVKYRELQGFAEAVIIRGVDLPAAPAPAKEK